jgi:hypothetical protein
MELEKNKALQKKGFMAEELRIKEEVGAASSELQTVHREALIQLDQQMYSERRKAEERGEGEERVEQAQFKRNEDTKRAEIERRKISASDSCSRIRDEMAERMKGAEYDWQLATVRWLSLSRRKVLVKQREDEAAKAGKKKRTGGR